LPAALPVSRGAPSALTPPKATLSSAGKPVSPRKRIEKIGWVETTPANARFG